MKRSIILVFSMLLVTSCNTQPANNLSQIEANAANVAQPSPSPSPELLTSETVLKGFTTAKLPIKNIEIYTEETDVNKLLGRPHQYVGKINFGDTRIKNVGSDKTPNSIEVFSTDEDLQARKTYTEGFSKSGGPFLQYIYSHKNVLLRLSHELLPKDAAEYEKILKTL